jgi:hypothetical protein
MMTGHPRVRAEAAAEQAVIYLEEGGRIVVFIVMHMCRHPRLQEVTRQRSIAMGEIPWWISSDPFTGRKRFLAEAVGAGYPIKLVSG